MSDPSQDQHVALINSALAQTAIERARRVQRRIEAENEDIGLFVSLYPSLDHDFDIVLEDAAGDAIGIIEATTNESGRDWLAILRDIAGQYRDEPTEKGPLDGFPTFGLFDKPEPTDPYKGFPKFDTPN